MRGSNGGDVRILVKLMMLVHEKTVKPARNKSPFS